MLHSKFRSNWPSGSGKEEFFNVYTIFGHDGNLGPVTWIFCVKFASTIPHRFQIKFYCNLPSSF